MNCRSNFGLHPPKVTSARRSGHTGSLTCRQVCKVCNEGWLSLLEDWAKKNMPGLISEASARISMETQQKLATWAAKTVMVLEVKVANPIETAQIDRPYIYRHRLPPNEW